MIRPDSIRPLKSYMIHSRRASTSGLPTRISQGTPQPRLNLTTVREELEKQGLSVVSTDPQNFSIRVHGNTAVVEKAFQTELHSFSYQKRSFQAHVRNAQLTGAAGELVDSVAGLDRHEVQPQISFVKDPKTGKALYGKKVTAQDTPATLFNITGTPLTAARTVQSEGAGYNDAHGYLLRHGVRQGLAQASSLLHTSSTSVALRSDVAGKAGVRRDRRDDRTRRGIRL